MIIRFERDNLLRATNILKNVSTRSLENPILANVLIDAKERIKMSATNLDIFLQTFVDGDIVEEGAITVPAKKMAEIVSALPSSPVELRTITNNRIALEYERGLYTLVGLASDEFPEIMSMPKAFFSINASTFIEMIMKTSFAASREARLTLNGVYLHLTDDNTRVVATDGRRLAVARTGAVVWSVGECLKPAPTEEIDKSQRVGVIVPLKAVKTIRKTFGFGLRRSQDDATAMESHLSACNAQAGGSPGAVLSSRANRNIALAREDKDGMRTHGEAERLRLCAALPRLATPVCSTETLKIGFSQNNIIFSDEKSILISRLVEGDFPRYESIIPKDSDMRIVLDTNNTLAALRRVSVLANPNRPLIKFSVHSDAVFFSAKTPDFGEAYDEVDILSGDGSIQIAFNAKYLMDALSHLETEKVAFLFKDPFSAVIIQPVDSEDLTAGTRHEIASCLATYDYQYIVMPMRFD